MIGHGTCYDMQTLATYAKINGNLAGYTYGITPNDPITWDAEKVYGCLCDDGWEGYDCSLKSCPYGHNPDYLNRLNEQQVISCQLSTNSSGLIQLTFREKTTKQFSPKITTIELKTILESLTTVGVVSVETLQTNSSNQICTLSGNSIVISFLTIHSDLPLINYNVQNITSFNIYELQKGTKEMILCSSRGICDYTNGLCDCFNGYGSSDGQGNAGTYSDCGYLEPVSLQ